MLFKDCNNHFKTKLKMIQAKLGVGNRLLKVK